MRAALQSIAVPETVATRERQREGEYRRSFERTNSWVARSESLVRDESQDENSLIQDDTTSQDQSASFILGDSCYLQAPVTFFFYHCQIICLCQARLLFSAGRRFFSLGPTGRKFRSMMRRRRRSFAAVSPVRPHLLRLGCIQMQAHANHRDVLCYS